MDIGMAGDGIYRAMIVAIYVKLFSQATLSHIKANMKTAAFPLIVATALAAPTFQEEGMEKRLENGLGRTPALGYNNWVCALIHFKIRITLNISTDQTFPFRTTVVAPTPPLMQPSKSPIYWYPLASKMQATNTSTLTTAGPPNPATRAVTSLPTLPNGPKASSLSPTKSTPWALNSASTATQVQ